MLQINDHLLTSASFDKYVTVYTETAVPVKGRILYFHGGGLLYGSRKDLPKGHIETLTGAGYEIFAFDYPLAPAAGLPEILEDVCASINWVCSANENRIPEHSDTLSVTAADAKEPLPYFLWGRSSGAYLCLIAAASGELHTLPKGILSYYGYGFLCDDWFCTPSSYYRTLPPVDASCLKAIPQTVHADGPLDTHYSVYVYARQTGSWKQLIYKGREKFFFLNYSLRACSSLPCPVFAAHSTGDTDVPYSEFLELCSRYGALRFIAPGKVHDFDRDPENSFTGQLLKATVAFLDTHL